jgi:hypothetical protein
MIKFKFSSSNSSVIKAPPGANADLRSFQLLELFFSRSFHGWTSKVPARPWFNRDVNASRAARTGAAWDVYAREDALGTGQALMPCEAIKRDMLTGSQSSLPSQIYQRRSPTVGK